MNLLFAVIALSIWVTFGLIGIVIDGYVTKRFKADALDLEDDVSNYLMLILGPLSLVILAAYVWVIVPILDGDTEFYNLQRIRVLGEELARGKKDV